MKIYTRVGKGALGNFEGYQRQRLIPGKKILLGERFTSNINQHINQRAGLFCDTELVDAWEIYSGTRKGNGKQFFWGV